MAEPSDLTDVIAELRAAGWEVIPIPPPAPPNRCMKCGKTDEGWMHFTDVTVTIADGEEGYAHVEKFVCEEDLAEVQEDLIEAGFVLHAHGGINYLEPPDCPGTRDMPLCPTPEAQYPG